MRYVFTREVKAIVGCMIFMTLVYGGLAAVMVAFRCYDVACMTLAGLLCIYGLSAGLSTFDYLKGLAAREWAFIVECGKRKGGVR